MCLGFTNPCVAVLSSEERLVAAADNGDTASMATLLSGGADVNWQNSHGESALMYASWRGHEAAVAALLQHPTTHVNLQVGGAGEARRGVKGEEAWWQSTREAGRMGYAGLGFSHYKS